MSVRPFVEADIPQVAGLYWTYMRRRTGPTSPAVISLFHDLYFVNPFTDPDFPSLVYDVADRGVVGFIGGSVRRMSVCGKSIRVLFGGNLVVHPEFRSGVAAPRLLSAFTSTDFDLGLTDSANNISKNILRRMGYNVVPALNIHWRRPLRPVQYAVYGVSVSSNSSVLALAARAAKPLCGMADAIVGRIPASPFRSDKPRLQGAPLDLEVLLDCMNEFRKGYSLWPEYDLASLRWLIGFMERQPVRGNLRKIVLRDENQKIVGWYIYYVKPGAVGEVVQVGGDLTFTKDILDHLFSDAMEQGVTGLHGMVDSRRMSDYSDKGCFFTCRGGWTVAVTKHQEIMRLLERGDAFFSRLDGEWCLDPGD